ncbi:transmembrane protease serine 12-like isoform X2 [Ahaetulla prasina]|uniref:transmembrane protease serine 12-like isoform X2 n=1 Tax=Ahaetulla prasina TaxID=499056 RepID=UPI002648BA00|nr:transmembrane protease serine 12-like isoform X2 [Ahaetulla prasina]
MINRSSLFPSVISLFSLALFCSSLASDGNECGIRPAVDISGSRIVGGNESDEGAWPWRPEWWRAVFGLHHLFKHKTYAIKRRIKAIKNYYFYDSKSYEGDIAVFQLSKSIIFNDYVQPICLPNGTFDLTSDMKCFVSGWGMKKEKGKGSLTLQEAQIKIFSLDTCNQYDWHAGSVPDTAFCAGSEIGGVDTCQGDSGGPLVCYLSDSKYYVFGITSYGIGCGRPKYPGVYTNLPKYMFWVKRQLSETNTVSIQQFPLLLVVWSIFQLIV